MSIQADSLGALLAIRDANDLDEALLSLRLHSYELSHAGVYVRQRKCLHVNQAGAYYKITDPWGEFWAQSPVKWGRIRPWLREHGIGLEQV